ncbi:MAG: hypothetical protein EOP42_00040 [Sphingobacteriaceae bacterium]|nr:MAG: hypothetical protein EOP42_00040 [Sphingobacteriaceae bacterium]
MHPKILLTGFLLLLALYTTARIPSVYYYSQAQPTEKLAAKELQRYIYLRTGKLPVTAAVSSSFKLPPEAILVATTAEISQAEISKTVATVNLKHDEYQLKTVLNGSLLITGGSEIATLYGAYKFLESTGIGFAIDGDLIPDEKTPNIKLTGFNKIFSPSFELRGIQPFHDFAEGPDWWNKDDYDAIITQLPKMGMNFIGFHTYPETNPFGGWNKAEPMVWIGTKDQVNADGTVKKAYPVLHANTGDSTWAYYPKKTSQFHFGAAQIFETDVFGADYMKNVSKWPHTGTENLAIFNQFGKLLNNAFTLAKNLGVKTCLGTEVPLNVPVQVQQNIQGYPKQNADSVSQALYEGLFTRIKKAHPLDYYWFWTPESWTWEGEAKGAVEQTEKDLLNALAAAKKVNAPFTLATCGWVLGPARNRSEFDKLLPKAMPFSVINRQQGYTPVEASFAQIKDRPKWEISWLEDDPALTTPQFWAGRTRKDAVDAYKYGCTGLMGIHWRTENLSPAFMALADAGWEAKNYKKAIVDTARDYPVDDLYLKWAIQQFGIKAAAAAARLFNKLDGAPLYVPGKNTITAHFPRSSEWGNRGPGKIMINTRSWKEVEREYAFIEDFKKLKPLITGASNTERYDYWLNSFLYAKTQAHVGCMLGQLQVQAKNLAQQKDKTNAINIAIALRQQLANEWGLMVTYLLQTVNTTGEMGTVANLEQHSLGSLNLLNQQDSLISEASGKPVPALHFNNFYAGPSKLIMTTKRTLLGAKENLTFKVRILSAENVKSVSIYWKPLGSKKFKSKVLTNAGRNVFDALLNSQEFSGQNFEYFVTANASTTPLRYPAAANTAQSVVVW